MSDKKNDYQKKNQANNSKSEINKENKSEIENKKYDYQLKLDNENLNKRVSKLEDEKQKLVAPVSTIKA